MTDPVQIVDRLRRGDPCADFHPINSGRHDLANLAREIVGHWHGKGDIVQVVTALLSVIDGQGRGL